MQRANSIVWMLLCLISTYAFGQGERGNRYGFVRPKRKVIAYGWEMGFREVSQMRRIATVMQRQPFDGVMFSLFHRGKPRDVAFVHSTHLSENELREIRMELSQIKWTTFTDNFLMIKAGERYLDDGEPSRMDWFDDRQWNRICHNVRALTRVAVAGKCVGLAFDPEPYNAAVWNYDKAGSRKAQIHRKTKSFNQYTAIVRKRGSQFMTAIEAEMPGAKIFNLYQAVRLPPSDYAEAIYSLYPAFINGILDAATSRAKLIDGNEYGFSLLTRSDYSDAYVNVKERKLALIDPKNRDTYRRQVQVAAPIFLDDIVGSYANRRWIGTYLSPDDKRQLFEHKLFHALDSVDEYVWVYGERAAWFSSPARVPRWAEASVRKVKERVHNLRLEERKRNKELISRVAARLSLRERETEQLTDATRRTPRVVRPKAIVRHIVGQAPVIDGKFDDAAWKKATLLSNFRPLMYLLRDERAVRTECRVTWNNDGLYLGFVCHEPRMAELKQMPQSRRKANRATLVFENGKDAYARIDFQLNERPRLLARTKGRPWSRKTPGPTKIQVAHQMTEEYWSAEISIPWAILGGQPKTGESRYATLTRIRAPWVEHDSWAPQIDPNLIDDQLLGRWVFKGSRE